MEGEFEIELDGVEYECFMRYDIDVDPQYGADADGNRGVRQTFIDIYHFSASELSDEDCKEVTNPHLLARLEEKASIKAREEYEERED